MKWFRKWFEKNEKNEFFEDSSGGFDRNKLNRLNEISDRLLADRIVFLGTPVDDRTAQIVIAQLLYLEHQSPVSDFGSLVRGSFNSKSYRSLQ